jgi:hypothetical protein
MTPEQGTKKSKRFTGEERAAMKERAQELRTDFMVRRNATHGLPPHANLRSWRTVQE